MLKVNLANYEGLDTPNSSGTSGKAALLGAQPSEPSVADSAL